MEPQCEIDFACLLEMSYISGEGIHDKTHKPREALM